MTPPETGKKFRSYVPDKTEMREFTVRAVLLGLVMTIVLGAANLYLGLRAGMTIAATYPAAVIGMAILRLMKGSILEENMARTIGSIGGAGGAGAGVSDLQAHRAHLSRGGDRHGYPAADEGLDSGREHGSYDRFDRRVGGRGRGVHHPRVRAFGRLARVRHRARLLEIGGADGGGRHAGNPVRHPAAAGDGGGPGSPVPRIGGRRRDS